MLENFKFLTKLCDKFYNYPHFSDEEPRVSWVKQIAQGHPDSKLGSWDWNLCLSGSKACTIYHSVLMTQIKAIMKIDTRFIFSDQDIGLLLFFYHLATLSGESLVAAAGSLVVLAKVWVPGGEAGPFLRGVFHLQWKWTYEPKLPGLPAEHFHTVNSLPSLC